MGGLVLGQGLLLVPIQSYNLLKNWSKMGQIMSKLLAQAQPEPKMAIPNPTQARRKVPRPIPNYYISTYYYVHMHMHTSTPEFHIGILPMVPTNTLMQAIFFPPLHAFNPF